MKDINNLDNTNALHIFRMLYMPDCHLLVHLFGRHGEWCVGVCARHSKHNSALSWVAHRHFGQIWTTSHQLLVSRRWTIQTRKYWKYVLEYVCVTSDTEACCMLQASIHYYCLNELFRTVSNLTSEGIRMYTGKCWTHYPNVYFPSVMTHLFSLSGDQTFRFYSGCSLAFEGIALDLALLFLWTLCLLTPIQCKPLLDRSCAGGNSRTGKMRQRSGFNVGSYSGTFILTQ